MDVRCERCRAKYLVDDDRVPESGVAVTCAQCGHVFRLMKKALAVTVPLRPEEAQDLRPITELAAPAGSRAAPAREWRLKQASGNVWAFRELTMLQKWIVERKVTRDDEISSNGEQWRRLADIPELSSFFAVVEEADSQARPSRAKGARPAGKPLPPMAPGAIDEPAWAQGLGSEAPAPSPAGRAAAAPKARRGGAWLALLALALAGALFAAWFYLSRSGEGDLPLAASDAGAAAAPLPPEGPRPREAEPPSRPKPAPTALAAPAPTARSAPAGPEAVPRPEKTPLAAPEAALASPVATAPREPAASPAATSPREPAAALASTPAPSALPPPAAPAAPVRAEAPAPAKKPAAPPTKGSKARSLVAQARRLRERGKTEAALALYGQAIDLDPANASALAGRGACYLETSDYAPAEASFRAALESDPKNAEALFGMAETYRYMGKKAEAVTFYERYVAGHPDGDDATAARTAIIKLKE